MSNPGVFLDVSIENVETKRIEIELWTGKYFRSYVEEFRSLCTGEKVGRSKMFMSYKGTSFERVIPGFMCQGGDLADWVPSFLGEDYLADENHLNNSQYSTGPGIVVMSKNNGSQFFICTGKTDWLDLKKHVVVGRVVKGMDVVKAIEKLGSSSGKTKKRVVIADCGQLL